MSNSQDDELSASARYGFAYPIVDAAFRVVFDSQFDQWKRKTLTSGSCSYTWSIGEYQYTAKITAALNDTTHCHIDASRPGDAKRWIDTFCFTVMQYVDDLMKAPLLEFDPEHPLYDRLLARFQAALPAAPKKRGPRTRDYNDRARRRIAANEPRETVYRDWLTDQGMDANSPEVRQEKRDTFRKAMSRKGRTDI